MQKSTFRRQSKKNPVVVKIAQRVKFDKVPGKARRRAAVFVNSLHADFAQRFRCPSQAPRNFVASTQHGRPNVCSRKLPHSSAMWCSYPPNPRKTSGAWPAQHRTGAQRTAEIAVRPLRSRRYSYSPQWRRRFAPFCANEGSPVVLADRSSLNASSLCHHDPQHRDASITS